MIEETVDPKNSAGENLASFANTLNQFFHTTQYRRGELTFAARLFSSYQSLSFVLLNESSTSSVQSLFNRLRSGLSGIAVVVL